MAFVLNGQKVHSDFAGDTPMLYVLRDQFELNGPRFGCGLGECGACTVLMDNTAVRSCSVPLAAFEGRSVTTLEGLGSGGKPSVVQAAFIHEQAAQCGFCINGMVMQATSLLRSSPHPTEAEIIANMDNNLCRCGTHLRILSAIKLAASMGGA
jgi:nicotinate dehydrogenase subunit A